MDRLLQEFEQVIRHLEKDYVLLPIASAQQIAALLRAGAEMREYFHGIENEATRVWDAALGGEDE